MRKTLVLKKKVTIQEQAEWLQWTILNYKQLAKLNQPPYGNRAIILKATGTLVSSCRYAPALNAFEQIPVFKYYEQSGKPGHCSTEFGLFYAISPSYQQQGYAFEAVQELIRYAFKQLYVK